MSGPFAASKCTDLATQTQLWIGLFEREIYFSLRRLSRDIRTFVDVGVAHGEYTLFALAKTSAERVVAFEPDEEMVARLKRNVLANRLDVDRLELYNEALGSAAAGCFPVERLVESITSPCLIKMDIDGGEAHVLESAAAVLRMAHVRWILRLTHSP